MKILLDLIRQPVVIGAFVLSILIVVGAYFGSHWYYGDVESIAIPENSPLVPRPPEPVPEVNLEGLPAESEQTPIESTSTPIIGVENESVDDFLAGVSDEEKAWLTAEVVEETQPVSPFGFGPYPEVPSDFPGDIIWETVDMYEKINQHGRGMMKAMELMDRVLIKLWNQGHRAPSASMERGLVYPGFPNTVYVEWAYTEEPDGTVTRYASEITSSYDVPQSVHDALSEGIVPPNITALGYDDGIDPYAFLNLNQ